MYNKMWFMVKIIISVVIWYTYFFIQKVFYPIMTNEQALKQFDDTVNSFTDLAMYQQFWNYVWVVPLIICLLIFKQQIVSLYYQIKNNFKENI